MKIVVTSLCYFGLCLSAIAQTESSGTIVIAQWTRDEIVIAADSREINGSSYSDSSCKIAALGNKLVFSASGRIGARDPVTNKLLWDGVTIAHKEFLAISNNGASDHLAKRLAEAWGFAEKEQFERHGEVVLRGLEDNKITSGIFADFERDGTLSVVEEHVTYEKLVDGSVRIKDDSDPVDPSATPVDILGRSEIVTELLDRKTSRAIAWRKKLRLKLDATDDPLLENAIDWVQLTIDNLSKTKRDSHGVPFSVVGPPIAAIRLVRGANTEWIRKGKCVKDEEAPQKKPKQ